MIYSKIIKIAEIIFEILHYENIYSDCYRSMKTC